MTSRRDETTSERVARILDSLLFGKIAWTALAVVLGIALIAYLVG